MKKICFLAVIFLALNFVGCNMELQNPNDLTLVLSNDSTERGVLNGYAMVSNLTTAKAIILKISQFNSGEPKVYRKDASHNELIVTSSSVTVPGVNAGQGMNIELQIMNEYCTYIARRNSVEVEPYISQTIKLEMQEVRPHLILWGGNNSNKDVYAVPDPNDKSLCFKSTPKSNGGLSPAEPKFAFDKFGRMGFDLGDNFSLINGPSAEIPRILGLTDNVGTLWGIDSDENALYFTGPNAFKIHKVSIKKDSFEVMTTGFQFHALEPVKAGAVGKNYCVAVTRVGNSPYTCKLSCLHKSDLSTVIKTVECFTDTNVVYELDAIVVDNKAYVLSMVDSESKMQVFSLPDLTLLKTVTGFFGAKNFVGERNGKLYITDTHSVKRRVGIYDTFTEKLEFIDPKEFDPSIDFGW